MASERIQAFDFARNLGSEIVKIYAGSSLECFVIHKNLLTTRSTFFDKALNGKWKESEENAIHLDDDDPTAIALMVAYLYTGSIPGCAKTPIEFDEATALKDYRGLTDFRPTTFGLVFNPITADDPSSPSLPRIQDVFQHVAFLPAFEKHSPEEIRLSDYSLLSSRPTSGTSHLNHDSLPAPTSPAYQISQPIFTRTSPYRLPHELVQAKVARRLLPLDFLSSLRIRHPRTPGVHLPGIPKCAPLSDPIPGDEEHQLALLYLCTFAERIHWPALFNAAVEGYISGELTQCRPIPAMHVDVIYERTYPGSSLRMCVMDSLARLDSQEVLDRYMDLAREHGDFMKEVFLKVSSAREVNYKMSVLARYHMDYDKEKRLEEERQGLFGRLVIRSR